MDFSGEKVWIGACSLMARWMLSKLADVKISGAWRLVMSRVLLGGDGWLRGGRSVRSIERFGERRFDGDCAFDDGGVETSIAIVAIYDCVIVSVVVCFLQKL